VQESRAVKIGVMGAGAIGCFVGGRLAARSAARAPLAAAGASNVVLVGRPRVVSEVARAGLTLEDLDGTHLAIPAGRLHTTTTAQDLANADVVLVAVKSLQTKEVGAELASVLRPGTLVVSLQNGLRNADVLRRELPNAKVLGGIVGFNVIVKGEGVYRRATSGLLVVEALADPRVAELARALRDAGFETEVTEDIRAKQWAKLVMNLGNAISALTDRPTREVLFDARYRRVLRAVMAEGVRVMRRAGVRPARLGALPVGLFPALMRMPTPLLRVVARAQAEIDAEARSSMWDDLTRGRATEVDLLNGEIVALAAEHGMRAPVNERVVALVHEAEARKAGSPKLGAEELYAALTRAQSATTNPTRPTS